MKQEYHIIGWLGGHTYWCLEDFTVSVLKNYFWKALE